MNAAQRKSQLQRELAQTRPFPSAAAEAALGIVRTADVLRRQVSAAIEPRGITMQQYNVLRILRGARPDPLPTLTIGERLIERTPGVTRLLDRLEEKGLVERERSVEDRRLVYCSITDEGLELLASMDEEITQLDDDLLQALHQTEIRTLIGLLDRIRSSLE